MKFTPVIAAFSAFLISACSLNTARNDQIMSNYDEVEKTAVYALNTVQERSFTDKVEYCGWVVQMGEKVEATEIVRGGFDSCRLPDPPKGSLILASFHTHGNHTPEYSSEFPSVVDVQGDFDTDIFGFISTPGGRVWVVDPFNETIEQACGPGCVSVDPTYNEAEYAYIPERFTREMIFGYFGSGKNGLH